MLTVSDIDPDITQSQRDKANRLIEQELPAEYLSNLHSSITPLSRPKLTQALLKEVERVAAKEPFVGGVDLAHYEGSEQVSHGSSDEALQQALRTAYTNTTYLRGRQMNLTLLEDLGKNAWLIGNFQTEDVQKRLESELKTLQSSTENTNKARKIAQEELRGELMGLEQTWKDGVGKIIETQVATDALRKDLAQKPPYRPNRSENPESSLPQLRA